MSTLAVNTFERLTGGGSVPALTVLQGTAKAWYNLNGTGTIAERDSFNVSSYTDNGVGDFTSTFTTAMPNANYAPSGTSKPLDDSVLAAGNCVQVPRTAGVLPLASALRIHHGFNGTHFDPLLLAVIVHGDPV